MYAGGSSLLLHKHVAPRTRSYHVFNCTESVAANPMCSMEMFMRQLNGKIQRQKSKSSERLQRRVQLESYPKSSQYRLCPARQPFINLSFRARAKARTTNGG